MNKWGKTSQKRLETLHPYLQLICNEVLKVQDCTIIYGMRTQEEQRRLVETGFSKTMHSKHLKQPDGYAHAVDILPYPVNWNNYRQIIYFAGIVKGIAHEKGINIRWGGDWNRNNDPSDETFFDGAHFELD